MKNSLSKLQTLYKIAKVLSMIVFVCSIIGFVCCLLSCLLIGIVGDEIVASIMEFADEALNKEEAICALIGSIISCGSEIAISYFAYRYFKNELNDGTPFTIRGSKELLRLGCLTIVVSFVSMCVIAIVYLVYNAINGFDTRVTIESGPSIGLGITFIIISLIYRCVIEKEEQTKTQIETQNE